MLISDVDASGEDFRLVLLFKAYPKLKDAAEHLRFIGPCNFWTLDKFRRSWQVLAGNPWNTLPADILLNGDNYGWCTILKQAQHHVLYEYG